MQAVLGANGQIAEELARELHRAFTTDIRLVSRNPRKVNDSDQLFAADLTDAAATSAAVAGSEIAYLTVGLPIDSGLWERQFPVMMGNTIAACREHGTKLVFFDNTYMYPRTSAPQVESTAFEPHGRKAGVRAAIATMLLDAMAASEVQAVIGRAPEFYGPGKTKSLSNSLVFDRIAAGKRALLPLDADTRRTLIWTPDASRGLALLGNTSDAYGETWHLPVDPDRLTYRQMIAEASRVLGRRVPVVTLPAAFFAVGGLVSPELKEAGELLPRYRDDNVFDSSKFAARFPDFSVTTYADGIARLVSATGRGAA